MDEDTRRNLINTYSQALTDTNAQLTVLLNNQRILINQLNHLTNSVRTSSRDTANTGNRRYYNNTRHWYTENPDRSRFTSALRNFYDRVPIVPTEAQINLSCRSCSYSDIENPINADCPISLDRFSPDSDVLQIIHCGHVYGRNSLRSWFQSNVHCPVCRYDIRNYREPLIENEVEGAPIPPTNTPNTTNTTARQSSLTTLAQTLLNELIPMYDSSSNSPFNSLYYDSIGDQIVFESYIRR